MEPISDEGETLKKIFGLSFESSDHRRKWNSTVAGELEKFLFAVAGEWLKIPIQLLRRD